MVFLYDGRICFAVTGIYAWDPAGLVSTFADAVLSAIDGWY